MQWWEDIYNRTIYFHLYEETDTKLARTEVEDVIKVLSPHPSARILDLCCGYGRHSIELAKKGFEVVGVDISQKQIQRAKEYSVENHVGVTFLMKDARKLPFANEFDIVLNMFLSFGYFEDEKEDTDMLKGVFRALKPKGRFLMDFWNREKEIREFKPSFFEHHKDISIRKEWEFDALKGRLNWKNTVTFPDGRKESWNHSIRAYTVAELKKLIEEAGLTVENVYGSLKGEHYSIDS